MFTWLYKRIRLLRNKGKEPYLSLYKLLGFFPNDPGIYEQAFLHRSSSVESNDGRWLNNERLEFLGDAVLGAIVADILYKRYPNRREGFLTNTRSKIVQRDHLNKIAIKIGLDERVVYTAKLSSHNNYLYGNALEALIGAIYLDRGYRQCFKFIEEHIIHSHIDLDKLVRKEVNFKSSLIEWSQKNKLEVTFELIESFTDNEGSPVFQTSVMLMGQQIGVGIGYSKKESQQNAAKMAVKKLRTDKEFQARIVEMKKQQHGEATEEHEFEELPDETAEAAEGTEEIK